MVRQKRRLIVSAILLVVVLVFALQNVAIVEVQFLIWGFRLPRSMLIFAVLTLGIAAGWFLKGATRRARPSN